MVTNIDVAALAICCNAYSKYVRATNDINKVALLISYTNKGGNKNVLQNPLIIIVNKYSEKYKKYRNKFGLTPNSRIKLAITKEFVKDNAIAGKGFGDV